VVPVKMRAKVIDPEVGMASKRGWSLFFWGPMK